MTEENINASKQDNQMQDKAADERLTDEQLDKVAGGRHAIEEPPQGKTSGK